MKPTAGISTALAFASVFALAVTVAAQAPQHDEHHPDAQAAPKSDQAAPPAGMSSMPNMQDMMKMRETMMAGMKADDDQMKALVEKMNKATGDAKLAAMAELLNGLADRQLREHGSMMGMQGQMMSQMMKMMSMMNSPSAK